MSRIHFIAHPKHMRRCPFGCWIAAAGRKMAPAGAGAILLEKELLLQRLRGSDSQVILLLTAGMLSNRNIIYYFLVRKSYVKKKFVTA